MLERVSLDKPIWVIGDVHGNYEKLISLIRQLPKKANICFVGDLVDRGDKSKEVINFVREHNYYCVKGNHEEMMINGLSEDNHDELAGWMHNGGLMALESYKKIPKSMHEEGLYKNKKFMKSLLNNKELMNDVKWMKELPTIIKFQIKKEKPLYVSHSGLKFSTSDSVIEYVNNDDEVMWNRKKQDEVDYAVNIHGHTPTLTEYSNMSKSQINIDSGGYRKREGYGFLTAIEYPSLKKVYSK